MAYDTAISDDGPGSLSMAMIASFPSPLLLLDRQLNIVAASRSFCRTFEIDPEGLAGRALTSLGKGEWNVPQLGSPLAAAIAERAHHIDACEMDLRRPGRETRRLVINVQKLVYGDKDNARLLLAISDVTEARFHQSFTDKVIREKSILLEELQHRVANSLQIIASVLMQSARRANCDETRNHLYDAHQRVMSVASLQKHLAATRVGDIEMRSYLTDLCKSIGASMIQDPNQLVLKVKSDDSVASANTAMSIGLMVTELVINAIKHGFPRHKPGSIVVEYYAHGSAWVLSVADNGVGRRHADPEGSDAGLGTSIVQALARHLNAEISLTDAGPGTILSITHAENIAFANEPVMTCPAA